MLTGTGANTIRIKVSSADLPGLLTKISCSGIILGQVERLDYFSATGNLDERNLPGLQKIIKKSGSELEILGQSRKRHTVHRGKRRLILLLGTAVLTGLTVFLPTRILFIEVSGCWELDPQTVISAAADCGIRFGASRKAVRSEAVKNQLLAMLPELQWAGINTRGCVAEIAVSESRSHPQAQSGGPVSSMVANQDAVITDMTVTSGTPACRIGDAVQQGQLLISGYENCGLSIRAGHATGEVYGQTKHQQHAVFPVTSWMRLGKSRTFRIYSLRIGKKELNFCKCSGISPAGCVKIRKEYRLKLPGGFILPVTWIVDRFDYYETAESAVPYQTAVSDLAQFSQKYLLRRMTAGKILTNTETAERTGRIYSYSSCYECEEMIGHVRDEEILNQNGKNN